MTKPVEAQTPRSVEIIEVIQVIALRGNGVDEMVREVKQYWSKDGYLLAEYDPEEPRKESE